MDDDFPDDSEFVILDVEQALWERISRDTLYELLGTPRCPWCRAPLIARCHPRRGPYFHCLCAEREEAARAQRPLGEHSRAAPRPPERRHGYRRLALSAAPPG